MESGMIGLVAGGVLAAHGVGHALGWIPAVGLAQLEGVSTRSWAVGAVLGDAGVRVVAGALFLVPTVGFIVAAAGLVTGQTWWRQVAVVSAAVSLTATALYPQAFSTGATVGSVAVNLAVLYGVLVAGWGSAQAVG